MIEPRDTPPDREPAIRMIAMPADANPSGDIFGGYIMSLMGSISPHLSADASAARKSAPKTDLVIRRRSRALTGVF